jgi:peptide/nickel transport system permease protein
MGRYVIRRTLVAIPTLIVISLIIFTILAFAPGDPTANLPLTVPLEVREQIRLSLGLGEPFFIRWIKWMQLLFISEPLHIIDSIFNTCIGDCESRARIISWSTRAPVFDTIWERIPQTLWVLGFAFVIGILIAHPGGRHLGLQAILVVRQHRHLRHHDGLLGPHLLHRAARHRHLQRTSRLVPLVLQHQPCRRLDELGQHPDSDQTDDHAGGRALGLFNAAALARFTRASVLDNLNEDYVRTARSKGLRENKVVTVHVVRNSLIPVVTLIALQIPGIFAGAIITEQIFRINGIGFLLINSINQNDVPMVQTLTFMFAVLIVLFNLIADVTYGFLDPRIRYD